MDEANPKDSAASVRLQSLTRRYGERLAVDAVSFTAPAGAVTAILGASGSGKSTLLRLIAGLEAQDAGTLHLGDALLSGPGVFVPAERRRIGMVFQDYALFPHLSLLGNVMFGLAGMERTKAQALAQGWLERVGLGHRASAYAHQLSGGEQQRVSLVRALAASPRAVLLDEPFSGLDRDLRTDLRDTTISALRAAAVTALFVTHDAEDAMLVADQIVIMHQGVLVQAGAPRTVYDAPVSARAARALGPINEARAIVRGGQLATPFATLPTGLADGAAATAVVRPEACVLTPSEGVRVTLTDRRPAGPWDAATIRAGDVRWTAYCASDSPWTPGQELGLVLRERGAHVFADAGGD